MKSIRSLSSLTICLFLQLSTCLLCSGTLASSSLWGQKIPFNTSSCLWQLQAGTVVPALEELSVCMLLRVNYETKWTGFVYKAQGNRNIELGLQGTDTHLEVWLFGEKQLFEGQLKLNEWSNVCLTWSGRARRLRVYTNGTMQGDIAVNHMLNQQLAPNGSLTLGVSHYVDNYGEVRVETGSNLLGEIGLFRMWAREWTAEELDRQSCADGDVLSWDLKQWKHNCNTAHDKNLQCAWPRYKIQTWTSTVYSTELKNCSMALDDVLRDWLESIFPHSFSVHDIFVSSPSHDCHALNNPAAQPQGSGALSNFTCDNCFSSEVYVSVNPPLDVMEVQTNLVARLSKSSGNFSKLVLNLGSIEILPVVVPAMFFRVNVTLNVTGSSAKEEVVEIWLKNQLEVNGTMTMMNLIITEDTGWDTQWNNGLTVYNNQEKKYYCTFHVRAHNGNSAAETETFISEVLKSTYKDDSITIQTVNWSLKLIVPENCLEETTLTVHGEYIWPETFPGDIQVMRCYTPASQRAYRLCKLNILTDTTSWNFLDMRNCNQTVTISDLDNVTVTTDNAAEVVDIIGNLVHAQLNDTDWLSASNLGRVMEKLFEVVDISIIKPVVGTNIVNIISDVLESETNMAPVANKVLNLTERLGNIMDFQEESVSVSAPLLALSMFNAKPDNFTGLTFGVISVPSMQSPEIFLNQSYDSDSLPNADASISLPSSLQNVWWHGQENETRVQYSFYATEKLFQDPITTNATLSSWTLNSHIVSASINNSHVSNLKDRVVVMLKHLSPKQPEDKVQCMFWDFDKNGGVGGWNSRGCHTMSVSSNHTKCLCDHLTHFAVLLDVSRGSISEEDSFILTVISYLGCGISSVFLGVTLLTYIAFEKLRRDYPSKILINLSVALLGLCMVFLLDSWLSSFSNYGLCIATAASLHYFVLASFTWMGLEAVHMYLALVKVFNTYIPSYILKFCAVGWGLPFVIVGLVLAIDKDTYGPVLPEEAAIALQSIDQFCWIQNDVGFFVAVVPFVLLILLCNISVFIMVLMQIRQMRANKTSTNSRSHLQDLRAVASLTVLLGLTWSIGFFSFGPFRVVLLYIFSFLNSLQGFFVFLFHCLMKENVRKQWRIHLCCGRFRLSNYSDWSRTVTVGSPSRKNNLVNSDSAASDSTFNIRKGSDSSTGSAPHHHQRV